MAVSPTNPTVIIFLRSWAIFKPQFGGGQRNLSVFFGDCSSSMAPSPKQERLMSHTFQVGQLVRATGKFSDRTGQEGTYEVVRLPADADGVPKYRIKSPTLGTERVVNQPEIAKAQQT